MKRLTKSGLLWKKVLAITLAVLFFAAFTAVASAATIYVPDNFSTIQQAVDNATAGDTIIVRDGAYTENVNLNKQLTIRSENGSASTSVQAANSDDHVFEVTVDYVNISGFTVTGTTGFGKAGICLDRANHCNISDNTASNNRYGIKVYPSSSNNTLTNNTANSNKQFGILLQSSSSYNTLTSNTASNNNDSGIFLYSYSRNNTLTSNTASSNKNCGVRLGSSSNDNLIYNNYFNNTNNAYDDGSNVWNITKTAGTNIIGGPYLGGNYWSDYAGTDTDGDCLGDTFLPYNSGGNIDGDYHPLCLGAPVLSIKKLGNPDPVLAGGTLNYSISVNNTGCATATNVTVAETYDVDVAFVSAVPAPSQGNETWVFPRLNVNETKWIKVSVTVNASTPNGTVLHNLVNVTCEEEVADYDIENTTVFSDAVHITSFTPPSPVNDTVCNWRTFNVTVDQTVNVSWYLNGSLLFTNESVRAASCTLHADAAGVHNVSAIASNANGSDMQTWLWNVKKAADLVITGKWLCWPDNCTICYNVTNIGNGTAPACHNTALYVDGVAVAYDHVPMDLPPGESHIGCFDDYIWTYTPPSDNITVCADNNDTLNESDETNNCLTNIWMCGDVNCDGKVTMSDVRKVFNRYFDPNYPVELPWAADVNGDSKVTMSDVRKVLNRYLDPGYELNCCCEV